MFQTILVPTDGSPSAEKAITVAVALAKKLGAKIIGISVDEPHPSALISDSEFFGATPHTLTEKTHHLARENVQKVAAAASVENVPCETVVAHSIHPDAEILATAQKYNCDLIVMGSHGHKGLSRLLIGSITQKVLAHASIPVLVSR